MNVSGPESAGFWATDVQRALRPSTAVTSTSTSHRPSAGRTVTANPNKMICGQRVGKNCHAPVQLRGSSRLGDGSMALECDRSCVVTSRAFSFYRGGAAAMIALFAVGFLAACSPCVTATSFLLVSTRGWVCHSLRDEGRGTRDDGRGQ